jgi:methyl-accepting chemotaxis protein
MQQRERLADLRVHEPAQPAGVIDRRRQMRARELHEQHVGETRGRDGTRTMRQIEAAITRVTNIVGDIAHASRGQSDGIQQVGIAITQMDEVAQQNAALVEQSVAAAASLADQARALREVMEGFRVG